MTSSRNSNTRPISYISASDSITKSSPSSSTVKVPQWKQQMNKLQAKTKLVQNHVTHLPEQFQQGALTAFIIAISLGCVYLIALIYTSPTSIYYLKVLFRVATDMLWLLLSWGIVAGICYYALNYLGVQSIEDPNNLSSGTSGSSARSTNIEWTNEFLAWMYNNFHRVPEPLDAWIRSLNEIAKKVTSPAKCEVLFESFGDHSNVVRPPKITDIKAVKGPRDHITIYANVHFPCIKLKLISSQRVGDRLVVSNLDGSIIDLRGEVECRVACIANQFYIVVCFKGRPEMDIELAYSDPKTQQQAISFGLVEESIRRCLLSAVTHINLSDCWPAVNFEEDPRSGEHLNNNAQVFSSMYSSSMERKRNDTYDNYTQPGNRRSTEKPMDLLNLHKLNAEYNNSFEKQRTPLTQSYTANDYDHVAETISSGRGPSENGTIASSTEVPEMFRKLNDSHLVSPATNANTVPNKLRIKVIKANRLGRHHKAIVQQPYVDIEMDEPSQKHTTSKGINANPYWEETFAFDLTPASEEILFEVYDAARQKHGHDTQNKDDESFLGLSLVNFEEIRRSGEQLHVLKLQGTPYKRDDITGELTVQFDFYYDPTTSNVGKFVDTVKIRDKGGNEFRETVTLQRRALYDPHDNFDVNDITPTKTTTVLVKTVSKELKEKPQIQSVHGSLENAIDPTTQRILEEQLRNSNDPKLQQLEAKLQKVESQRKAAAEGKMARSFSSDNAPNPSQNIENRGRDRTKKNGLAPGEKRERSFFGELRDRLSGRRKSQKRSKSVDVNTPEIEEAVSLPPSRDASRTRYAVSHGGSGYLETQSVGGLSGESTKSLYQHSTLILEVDEDKQKKYFLIPPSILTEPAAVRLMKKGRKLHIYNDHTFVAVKIRGGINCHVCQHRIKSSFSKQAYQCRDCKLVCHKSCHYKTDAFCTKSTVSKLHIAKDIDWAHFLSHYQLEEFISLEGV